MSWPSKKLLLLALLALLSLGAYSQVYKWVDEEGNVHYGDSPPDDADAERIHIEAHTPEQMAPADAKLLEDADERYRRLAEDREARAAARLSEEQARSNRDQRCVYLRKQLISLQQQLPVYRDEEGKFRTLSKYDVYEGEREYLDDATRAQEIEGVKREIDRACEEPGDRGEQSMAAWDRMKEKRCESARLELREAQRDERAPTQTIEDAQAEVDRYCAADK